MNSQFLPRRFREVDAIVLCGFFNIRKCQSTVGIGDIRDLIESRNRVAHVSCIRQWLFALLRKRIDDMKFEVVVIPVADVDRSKEFYTKLGWRLDADFPFDNGFRVVQFTPPGSGCSVQFGTKMTSAAPGSAQGLYLIVSDVEAARQRSCRPRY
jgi:predicted enzyme related to lactoylglutathione lyase